jgi:hypothetical protein
MERVARVADELKASELVDQGKAPAATFVVLRERAAGRAAMQEVWRDRDISHVGDMFGRVALDVGEPEQLAKDPRRLAIVARPRARPETLASWSRRASRR